MWNNWVLINSNEFNFMKPGHGNSLNESVDMSIKDTASSAYQFLIAVGIVGLVCSMIFIACLLVIKKNGSEVHEVKDQVKSVIMAALILFSAASLIILAIGIGLG